MNGMSYILDDNCDAWIKCFYCSHDCRQYDEEGYEFKDSDHFQLLKNEFILVLDDIDENSEFRCSITRRNGSVDIVYINDYHFENGNLTIAEQDAILDNEYKEYTSEEVQRKFPNVVPAYITLLKMHVNDYVEEDWEQRFNCRHRPENDEEWLRTTSFYWDKFKAQFVLQAHHHIAPDHENDDSMMIRWVWNDNQKYWEGCGTKEQIPYVL